MLKWLVSALIVFSVSGGAAFAQSPKGSPPKLERFAVINIQKVLRISAATRAVKPQIQQIRDRIQKQIQDRERSLKAENEALQRERSILSPQAYEQRRRDFQSKVSVLQSDVQGLRRRLDAAGRAAMAQVNQHFRAVAAEIAKERQLQIIIPRATALFVHPSFDITDEVLKRLNKRLPSVKVALPPAQAVPAAPKTPAR